MMFLNKLNVNFEFLYRLEFFWIYSPNIVCMILISLLIIFFGMTFPSEAKSIKIINMLSAYLIILFFLLASWEFIYYLNDRLYTHIICDFNYTIFVNYFFFFITFIIIFYYFSISKTLILEENSKMEFSLLIFYIYMANVMLITMLDLISIILLLECIAFSSYVLIGYERKNKLSATAALKYLIIASIPAGFFILGIIILYLNFGTFFENYLYFLITSLDFVKSPNWFFFLENFKNINFISYESDEFLLKRFFLLNFLWEYSFNLEKNLNYLNLEEVFLNFWAYENIFLNLNEKKYFSNNVITSSDIEFYFYYFQMEYITWYSRYILIMKEIFFFIFLWKSFFFIDYGFFNQITLNLFFQEFSLEYNLTWINYIISNFEIPFENISIFEINNIKFSNEFLWFLNFFYQKSNYFNYIFETFNSMDENILVYYMFSTEILYPLDYWEVKFDNFIETFLQTNYNEFFFNFLKENLEFSFIYNFKDDFIKNTDVINIINTIWIKFNSENFYDNFFNFKLNLLPIDTFFNLTYSYDNIIKILNIVIIFILINICFKITAAPFHAWAPRIYGNSSLPVVTFLSIFSKLTLIFFTLWLFFYIFDSLKLIWQPLIFTFGVLSIFFSLLGSFSEKLIRRFFVYSSMSHVGFMLLGFGTLTVDGILGTINYLMVYCVSSFIIWYSLMHLTKQISHLIGLKGLSFNNPVLSWILSITLFSFSGLPPMGGFFVKYEILNSILNSSYYFLGFLVLFCTIVSFYYYLRLIKIIFFEDNLNSKQNKNLNDFQLRIIAYGIIVLPFFIFFIQEPFIYFLYTIILSSFK